MADPTYGSANQFTTENFLDPFDPKIFMPTQRRELLGFQQDVYFMSDIFEELKLTEPVNSQTWETWVEPKKVDYLVATSSASAGAVDAAVDVVINATNGIAGGVYARVGDTYRRKNGEQLLVANIVKSTRTITFLPLKGTAISAVAANEIFVLVGTAFPEASNPMDSMTGRARQYKNYLQIQQGKAKASGSVQEDKLWFDVPTPQLDGTTVNSKFWYSWEIKAERDRIVYKMNQTLLTGVAGYYDTSAFTANFGADSQGKATTTNGLITQAMNEGGVFSYAPGEPSMNWFYKLINQLIKNEGDRENMLFCGMQFSQANMSWIVDQFKNGAITYGAFNGNKDLAVKLGFKSLEMLGFNFHWKELAEYNNPSGLGALDFGSEALVIPTTPVKVVGGSMAKPVRLRHKPVQGGKMMAYGFRNSTRNSPTPNSTGDFDSVEMIAEWGVEMLAPWKSLRVKKN